jgi:hypothetical protein
MDRSTYTPIEDTDPGDKSEVSAAPVGRFAYG